jgi:hypothetical protein
LIKDGTELRKDGQRTLESGMNSGRDPTLLTPNECAYADNVTFRGGYPSNRQQFVKVAVTDGGNLGGFAAGLYQGSAIYDIDDGDEFIMTMIGGTLFELSLTAGGITVKQLFDDNASNRTAPQCWFCQADIYMVIQDGTTTPIVMQGLDSIRRATGANEVPVGESMAYVQGRLWVAQGRSFVAGDLLGGGTSVIDFTEQTYADESFFFGVPLASGNIVGMTSAQVGDTTTGQGELIVFARNSTFSVQASVPRAATATQAGWQGTTGMQRVTLPTIGGTGWRNILSVNADIFFRSKDGWRTYRTARNEQYGWGGAPISRELNRILPNDSLTLLDYSSSVSFRNRVILTAEPLPYKAQGGASFGALVVLDLDVISSVIDKSNLATAAYVSPFFIQRGSPAYDGRWSLPNDASGNPLRILQILSGTFAHVERCFIFAYNTATSLTEIWELVDGNVFDQGQQPITSQIETKAFDFKLPDALKRLRAGFLFFNGVQAAINVTVEYRSDGYPNWIPWGSPFPLQAHQQPCTLPGCTGTIMPGYWFRHHLITPNGTCDPNTGKLIKNGYWFQLRITWKGPATLIMLLIHAEELVEDPNGGCP